jgi:hypothetical protein
MDGGRSAGSRVLHGRKGIESPTPSKALSQIIDVGADEFMDMQGLGASVTLEISSNCRSAKVREKVHVIGIEIPQNALFMKEAIR